MTELTTMTSDIAIAFVSNNIIPAADVPSLIASIHGALTGLDVPKQAVQARAEPAVSIRASVKPDHIVCLECGSKHKMLKRHLTTTHGLDEHAYRAKWNLPSDYPLVAPAYAARRREIAMQTGLGRKVEV